MPLGSPDQGQRIASLVEELVRKDKEREEREAMEGAPTYGPDLGEFMQVTEQTEAQNAQELQRREAERESFRQRGQIDFNQREEEDRNSELNRRLNQQFPMSSGGF
tara:strand:+ start:415 stop:732 length:318 start_codon:yes stop_codon:yes gene_type:complete